jgi:hypothetical protein
MSDARVCGCVKNTPHCYQSIQQTIESLELTCIELRRPPSNLILPAAATRCAFAAVRLILHLVSRPPHRISIAGEQFLPTEALHLTPPPCTFGNGVAGRPDHAMVCGQCKKQATSRHDIPAAVVGRAALIAGLPSNSGTSYLRLAASTAEVL